MAAIKIEDMTAPGAAATAHATAAADTAAVAVKGEVTKSATGRVAPEVVAVIIAAQTSAAAREA